MNPHNPGAPLYIFDLDGTLALIDHRRPLVEAPHTGEIVNPKQIVREAARTLNRWAKPDVEITCDDLSGLATNVHFAADILDGSRSNALRDKNFKPDWAGFYQRCDQDAPNWPVLATMLQLYTVGCDIRIWSGREDSVRGKTLMWLHVYTKIALVQLERMLTMRPAGDYTPDQQLKRKWLHAMTPEARRRLTAVFDDRNKVVDMWREEKVACFQVAPGEF